MRCLPLVLGIFSAGLILHSHSRDEASDAAAALAKAVKGHVRLLNDRELSERDGAEAKLLSLGPKVLALLPPVTDRMPAELKHRLTRIRQKLELAEAESAAQPTQITIQGKGMPLAEVLAAIEKQTGNKLIDFRESFGQEAGDVISDVDIDKQEFWPALDSLLDQAGLTTYPYHAEEESSVRSLALVARDVAQSKGSVRGVYAGPFRLEPVRVDAMRDLRNPAGQGLRVQIEVAWEPRLAPIALTLPQDSLQALDSEGKEIAASDADTERELTVEARTSAVVAQIGLVLPPRSATAIATLKGKLNALVPGSIVEFRFENIEQANKVELRQGGAVVTLETVRQNNELWQVFMRAKFDAASKALESHRDWFYNNEAYVLDANGERVDYGGFEKTREAEDEFGMAYLFDLPKGPKGMTFVYKTPVAMMNLPVEFELKEIPLP